MLVFSFLNFLVWYVHFSELLVQLQWSSAPSIPSKLYTVLALNADRTSTKSWFSFDEFPDLVGACLGAVGIASMLQLESAPSILSKLYTVLALSI